VGSVAACELLGIVIANKKAHIAKMVQIFLVMSLYLLIHHSITHNNMFLRLCKQIGMSAKLAATGFTCG